MRFQRSLFLTLIILSSSCASILSNWKYASKGFVRWRENCEFNGYDIGSALVSRENCKMACIIDHHCNAFTYKQEVCYKKAIPYSHIETDVDGPICGWLPIR